MSNFRNVLQRIWQYRFGVLLLFFFIVAGFIGEYSFYQYWSLKRQNMELAERIDQYQKEFQGDTRELHQLETSIEAVEKVARVNLLMKSENEDVYVVVEE
jgi:putative septum formation initiator-related protein